jgi:hypothetical protein
MRYGSCWKTLSSSPLALASGVARAATRPLAVPALRLALLLAPARLRTRARAVLLSPVTAPADPGE